MLGFICCDVDEEVGTDKLSDVTTDNSVKDVETEVEGVLVASETCGSENLDLLFGGEDVTVQMVGVDVDRTFRGLLIVGGGMLSVRESACLDVD